MTVAYQAVSHATGTDATGEGSFPAGVANGDLLLAFVIHNSTSATITNVPTGWSLVEADPNPADFATWVYKKNYATGDSAPTWTFSAAGNWVIDITRVDGHDSSDSTTNSSGHANASSNAINVGNITPGYTNMLMICHASVDASGGARTWTEDASLTEVTEQTDNQLHRVIAWELLTGTSSVNRTLTVSGSAQDMAGFMILVKPAPSGTQFNQSVSGAITPAGALAKRAGKILAGGLSFVGALVKRIERSLTGALSFSGALVKRSSKSFTATLTSVGTLIGSKVSLKSLDGSLSFLGALGRLPNKNLAGSLSSSSTLLKQTSKNLVGGLSFSGLLSSIRLVVKILTGALSFSGSISQQSGKALAGILSFTGALSKRTYKSFTGTLSFSGIVTSVRAVLKSLVGALSFTGSLTSQKLVTKILTGALSFTGDLAKRTSKSFTGALSFSGALASIRSILKSLGGSVSFSGSLDRQTSKLLEGGLSFVGGLSKRIGKILAGALSFIGDLTKFLPGGARIAEIRFDFSSRSVSATSITRAQQYNFRERSTTFVES